MADIFDKAEMWLDLRRQHGARLAEEPELPLNHGSGGGTSTSMEPSMKDYVDARNDAVESRLSAKLDTLATKSTIWGAMATAVALILAAIAFGGDRFDSGMGMGDVRQAQLAKDADQDRSLKSIDGKLDQLIAAQKAAPKK